jgi:rod shape-determining protein MreD
MRSFHLVLTILMLLLMQLVVADRIAIKSVSPDFVILIVAFFALYRGTVRGSVFGFFIGFLQDLTNPGLLGLNALTKSMLGFAIGKVGSKTFPENAPFLFAVFMAVSFGHDVVYLIFYKWPRLDGALATAFATALPSAAYTALFGVLVHRLISLAGPKVVESIGKEGQQ